MRYSRTKEKLFLRYKNNKIKRRKMDIFPNGLTLGFCPKRAIFPTFFLGNIGQENVFYDILEQTNAFLGFKNKTFKKSKIDIFLKGLTYGFSPKMAIFPTFFFKQYRPGNVFYAILQQTNAFLCYKNKKFKNSKN